MPRGSTAEPTKPIEPEEQVDLEDNEEGMEEEEEEEYEEVEEIEEFEEEEEVEEDGDEDTTAGGEMDSEPSKNEVNDQDKNKTQIELLALPPHGCEIYVGGIPHDFSENDLKSFCESIGEVTEVRIIKGKDSRDKKGYAFVVFKTKELAEKAVEDLNNVEIKGKKLKVSKSQAKNKLFIGNIPKTWKEDDLRNVVNKVGPGVEVVELVKDSQDSNRNRGFAFVEYYNHACAEFSRKIMSASKFKLDSNTPTVNWSDKKSSDTTSQVKAIYVKNLPKDVTQDQLKELFQRHGEITRVILPPAKSGHEKSRYGFVHFAERSAAMKSIKNTEKYDLDGQVLECSIAKPPSEKKNEVVINPKPVLPAYPLRGIGMMGAGYGLAGNFGVSPFGQSMMYGRGPTGPAPAGVSMVPMILPDGRFGYVLQQPGVPLAQPQRRGGSRGGSSSYNRQSDDNNRNRRYNPY